MTHEIQTNGIAILFVEVSEDAYDFRIDYASIIVLSWVTTNENGSIELSSGKWVELGKSTEITEEQMKEICEECDRSKMNLRPYQSTPYKNYLSDGSSSFSGDDTWFKWNVQESYLSLLEANGIVDRNNAAHPSDIMPQSLLHYEQIKHRWQESQSKVKHYLVLKRI